MADHLITLADIYTITGLYSEDLEPYIPYAEAQAEQMLGFLNKETKTEEQFVFDKSTIVQLEYYPINSISSIKYKSSASASETTVDTDEYRAILNKGMLIFDVPVEEGYTLSVEYEVGWDQTTVTNLVKLLLSLLVIDHYYSFRPDQTTSSQIVVSEKIGDYAIKYADMSKTTFASFHEWASHIAMLIKRGGNIPDLD